MVWPWLLSLYLELELNVGTAACSGSWLWTYVPFCFFLALVLIQPESGTGGQQELSYVANLVPLLLNVVKVLQQNSKITWKAQKLKEWRLLRQQIHAHCH